MKLSCLAVVLGFLVLACGGGSDPVDPDASSMIDAASPDGPDVDAASPDAASTDAASPDAAVDAGGPDAPAWDPGPVGNVLAQTVVTVDGTTQTVTVGTATVVIPAGALPNGTLLILRLSNGVNRAGGTPVGGLVMQFLTNGVAPSSPLTLRLPSPGPGSYTELSSAEAASAWTDEGPASTAGSEVVIGVSHFSLWTASAAAAGGDWAELGLNDGGPTYAGITSAVTAAAGGGIEILFPTLVGTSYWIYVRPQTGTHNFHRAHAMTVAGNNPMFLGGLTPGVTYCVTVRVRSAQVEDGNTAEQCAVAAATPAPATMTMGTPPPIRWTDSELTLTVNTGLAASLRYELERQIDGGGFAVVATRQQNVYRPGIDESVTFTDVPEVAGAYQYRVRAFADGVDVRLSDVQAFAVITKPWKQVLPRYPQTLALRPSPQLLVDNAGRLVVQGVVSPGSASAFLTAPAVASLRRGPDLTGDAALWKRLWCRYQDVDFNESISIHHQAVARAADGSVFVLEASIVAGPPGARVSRLFRIGPTGCAQIVNTELMGVFDLAVHPTDPLKLAVAANRGVFVSSDGGVSFRLFGGYQPRAAAYSAGGTLYLATTTVMASSPDLATFTNYGTWPDANDPPRAMTIRADGTMAAIGGGGTQPQSGAYVGPAGGTLVFEDSGLADPHLREGLTWLGDGRLLVLMQISNPPGGPAERRLLAVRAAAGGWSTLEIPGPWRVASPLLPVLFDLRPGHAADLYAGYHRSRDGGITWEMIPLGKAVAATIDGANLALFVTSYNGSIFETRRSLDGGDTGVLLPSALPDDGRTWFDPVTPLNGYNAYNQYTTNGGSTWSASTGAGNFGHVGFAGGPSVFATPVTTGPGSSSANDGASWTVVTGTNRTMACGNGTIAIVSASGGIQTWSGSSFGSVTPIAIPRTCAVSADGQTVYLGTTGGVQKSTTGIAGPYTALLGSVGGTTPMRVSADGLRLSFNGWWTETGGQ